MLLVSCLFDFLFHFFIVFYLKGKYYTIALSRKKNVKCTDYIEEAQ